MSGLIGKKIGMTNIFAEDGKILPCTVVQAGPCTVTQVRTKNHDGYDALQLGFNEKQIERNNELMDVVADISQAYDVLNWKPKLDIREGLTKILIEEGMCSLV